jgi:hypothetical protein
MNNNTRGFVALLFLEVLVPTTVPPAAQPGYCVERRISGAMEMGSLQIIMLIDSLIIFYYDVIFSIPLHIQTSSGVSASE